MGLEELQTKDYFSIGDVKRITGVPEYSVRYWEREFNLIRPVRLPSGHRRYSKADVYTILKIKDLIYKHKLTLEGAKKQLGKHRLPLTGDKQTAPRTDLKLLKTKTITRHAQLQFPCPRCDGGDAHLRIICVRPDKYRNPRIARRRCI